MKMTQIIKMDTNEMKLFKLNEKNQQKQIISSILNRQEPPKNDVCSCHPSHELVKPQRQEIDKNSLNLRTAYCKYPIVNCLSKIANCKFASM